VGTDRLGHELPDPDSAARLHWTGLSPEGLRLAWILLGTVFIIDVVLQLFAALQGGRVALGNSRSLLGMWDLAKAITVGTALIYTAGRITWRPIATLGVLFLIVGIEDQIAIHGELGKAIAGLVRFDAWIPGIGRYGANNLGEFFAMAIFGLVAFLLIWAHRASPDRTMSRARLIFTILLVVMFFFAGVIDLMTAAGRSLTTMLIEELGERATLSLSVVYALSLVRTYPGHD
jgi:hypothetical protein